MKTKTMKTKLFLLIAFLITLAVLTPQPAEAQTATYSTITSSALNLTQTCFIVASTTSMSASGALTGAGGAPQEWDIWVDGEFMKINTVNTTSNQVCVQRGKSPTRAGLHATASVVFYGPAGATPFIVSAPIASSPGVSNVDGQFGSCVSTAYQFLPLIQVTNGSVWNCVAVATLATAVGRWNVYGFRAWTTGHPIAIVTDANYTASLADEFIVYQKATAGRTVTLPAITGIIGKSYTIAQSVNGATQTITVQGSNAQAFGSMAGATSLTLTTTPLRVISVLMNGVSAWVTW